MLGPLLPLLALTAAAPAGEELPDWAFTEWAQLTIHERIVIRLTRRPAPPPPADDPAPVRWTEKRADRCVPMGEIAGALLTAPGSVDLLMVSGKRMRAMLGRQCPTLDYYFGVYLHPTGDGRMCADRDSIRTRSGAVCPIRQFRRLEPGK